MDRSHVFGCFDFDHYCIFHHQIHLVGAFQFDPFVVDRQMNLPLKPESKLAQLIAKALFAGGL